MATTGSLATSSEIIGSGDIDFDWRSMAGSDWSGMGVCLTGLCVGDSEFCIKYKRSEGEGAWIFLSTQGNLQFDFSQPTLSPTPTYLSPRKK